MTQRHEWFRELTQHYGFLDDEASELLSERSMRSVLSSFGLWLKQRRESVLHIQSEDGVSWDEARLLARCKEDELSAGSGIDCMNDEHSCIAGRLVH